MLPAELDSSPPLSPSGRNRIHKLSLLAGCTSQAISLNTTVSGNLGPGDCTGDSFYVDFYQFHATSGTSVTIVLSSTSLGEVFVTVQDFDSGAVLASKFGNGSASLNYHVTATNNYFIGVTTLTGTFTTGAYRLSTSTASSSCEIQPLSLNTRMSGTLSSGDCAGSSFYADFFTFHGSAGDNVHIVLSSSTLGDVLVTVQDSHSGTVLASNHGNGSATLTYPIPLTDDYVIGVTTLTGTFTTGPYSLVTSTEAPSQGVTGIGINLDVIGRVTGSGNTLFRTAVDIANNTGTATEVDAFVVVSIGGQHFEVPTVSVTAGGLVREGAGTLSGHSVFHTDDFIDDLRSLGLISQAQEATGMIGSVLVVYNSPSPGLFDQVGQGTVEARFYSASSAGTIGVAANGHELSSIEPISLVGIARDTIGENGTPQMTTNFFINNEGFVGNDGSIVVSPVTIRMSGYSNGSGNPLPKTFTFTIADYETAVIGDVYSALGANPAVDGDSVVVAFDIVGGNSAISGLSASSDLGTKDPSAAQLRPTKWTLGR